MLERENSGLPLAVEQKFVYVADAVAEHKAPHIKRQPRLYAVQLRKFRVRRHRVVKRREMRARAVAGQHDASRVRPELLRVLRRELRRGGYVRHLPFQIRLG